MALKWVLADDSQDKIEQGKIVINGNTTFNGDATIVSSGTDETTIIKGGNITFTRGGKPITVIRNMRMGEVETDSNGKGIISFPDFKNMKLFLSIKSFAIGQNVRSLGCYANLLNLSENKYQTFIYGTESSIGQGTSWSTPFANNTQRYTRNCVGIYCSHIHIRGAEQDGFEIDFRGYNYPELHHFGIPKVEYKIYFQNASTYKLVKQGSVNCNRRITKQYHWDQDIGSQTPEQHSVTRIAVSFDIDANINFNDTSFNSENKTLICELRLYDTKVCYNYPSDRHYNATQSVALYGSYNVETINNLSGSGSLFYLAMEE